MLLIGLAFVYRAGIAPANSTVLTGDIDVSGVFSDLERKLMDVGVIDETQWAGARTNLNLLWAFGLANENRILTEGPMMDVRYGGAGRFASTGGWTLTRGSAMDHYAMHPFVMLTEEQQQLVERVSKNIYRPCCGNPVYFPDCNHGMAMLGYLEILASRGVSEDEMYRAALAMNEEWFPDTYDAIRRYFEARRVAWADVDPKTALGEDFSSAAGYARVLSEVEPVPSRGGGSCGV